MNEDTSSESTMCYVYIHDTGFPRLLETPEKPGIYLGFLNPGNILEFCLKTLNPLEICERQKIDQHIFFL